MPEMTAELANALWECAADMYSEDAQNLANLLVDHEVPAPPDHAEWAALTTRERAARALAEHDHLPEHP